MRKAGPAGLRRAPRMASAAGPARDAGGRALLALGAGSTGPASPGAQVGEVCPVPAAPAGRRAAQGIQGSRSQHGPPGEMAMALRDSPGRLPWRGPPVCVWPGPPCVRPQVRVGVLPPQSLDDTG